MTNAQKRYYRAQGIDPAQIERDIRQREQDARENARIERDAAQPPRIRRRVNPALMAIATALMIGGNEK